MLKAAAVLPRGVRNNNPLNLRYSVNNHWKGKVADKDKKDDMFEEFYSIAYGVRAACRLIQVYVKHYGCSTIRSIIYRFAPPTENDTLHYYKYVKEECGSYCVDVSNDKFMFRLIHAMWYIENGQIPTRDDCEKIRMGIAMYLSDYELV